MAAISGLVTEAPSVAAALAMSVRVSDYVTVQDDGCIVWTAAKSRGYGQAHWLKGDGTKGTGLAHRRVYEAVHGPLPKHIVLDHLCHDPETCQSPNGSDCPHRACVNPDHLRPVTARENNLRSIAPPALNAAKTHCKNGHEFNDENTYIHPGQNGAPHRFCRPCRAAAADRHRQRKRAAQGGN